MAIEVTCPACAKRVRVQDDSAGKKFRCPHCQAIGDIPAPTPTSISAADPVSLPDGVAGGTGWRMKTPDGQIYGPVPKAELDSWVDEGRIIAECQLLRPASSIWEWASAVYPRLAAAAPGGQAQPVMQPVMMPAANPYAAPVNPFMDRPYQPMPGAPYPAYGAWGGVPMTSEKSRIAAGLYAIFLGWLGVHNFYLGRNGVGVTQLLITCLSCGYLGVLITWPWSWIEAVMIFAGAINTDGDGRTLRS